MNPLLQVNRLRLSESPAETFCSVTGGTTVVSDWLKIRITSDPGNSFLDRMIALVEGASREKNAQRDCAQYLTGFFDDYLFNVIVPFIRWRIFRRSASDFDADCPGCLPDPYDHWRFAFSNRDCRYGSSDSLQCNRLSGKAVEACGDVDTMILDKTGTITYGNRLAADFFPVDGADRSELIRCAALTCLHDDTPEGKSTLELAHRMGDNSTETPGSNFIEFTAQTRMSGVDLPNGTKIRKGAADAIENYVKEQGGHIPKNFTRRSGKNFFSWRNAPDSL